MTYLLDSNAWIPFLRRSAKSVRKKWKNGCDATGREVNSPIRFSQGTKRGTPGKG
jgi:hypothetical protein